MRNLTEAQALRCGMGPAPLVIQHRFTQKGAAAPKGAANPYRSGTAAATWWQRGHDSQGVQEGQAR